MLGGLGDVAGLGTVWLFMDMPLIYARRPLEQRLEQRVTYRMESHRLQQCASAPLLFFETPGVLDLLNQSRDPGLKVCRLFTAILEVARGTVALAALLLLFFVVGWWVPLVVLIAVCVHTVSAARLSGEVTAFTYEQTEDRRRVRYIDTLLTGRTEQKEIRVFGMHPVLRQKWTGLSKQYRTETLRKKRTVMLRSIPIQAGSVVIMAGIPFLLMASLANHRIVASAFVALLIAVVEMHSATTGLARRARTIAAASIDTEKVRTAFGQPPSNGSLLSIDRPIGQKPFPRPMRTGIRLSAVTFAYPGQERPALDRVNFHLSPREHVALVGTKTVGTQ